MRDLSLTESQAKIAHRVLQERLIQVEQEYIDSIGENAELLELRSVLRSVTYAMRYTFNIDLIDNFHFTLTDD